MLATPGPLPTGPGWAYEFKWDGVRVLVDVGPDGLGMTSRRGNDVSAAYPELAGLRAACPDILLDGEVVALADGRPSFAALQNRMHVRSASQAKRLAVTIPVTYFAFDVLRLYGVDLTARPYAERRSTLERLELSGPNWTVPPAFDDGPATAAAAEQNGLEGVVAKRLAAPYRPGARTPDWIKVRIGTRQEFVVGGWEAGEGGRASSVGSLLLGYYDDAGALRYAGQVGTGFTARTLAEMTRRLAPLRRPSTPFADMPTDVRGRPMTWVEPEIVVEVEFAEWTPDGRLRFASFQGERDDKDPRDVHRD
ncbi:MAG: bifunctional non-ous end joining protein LigD [Mycobacteriales bacterium]|jgi:bifunctional non-homologous end joining protein LigD